LPHDPGLAANPMITSDLGVRRGLTLDRGNHVLEVLPGSHALESIMG